MWQVVLPFPPPGDLLLPSSVAQDEQPQIYAANADDGRDTTAQLAESAVEAAPGTWTMEIQPTALKGADHKTTGLYLELWGSDGRV